MDSAAPAKQKFTDLSWFPAPYYMPNTFKHLLGFPVTSPHHLLTHLYGRSCHESGSLPILGWNSMLAGQSASSWEAGAQHGQWPRLIAA